MGIRPAFTNPIHLEVTTCSDSRVLGWTDESHKKSRRRLVPGGKHWLSAFRLSSAKLDRTYSRPKREDGLFDTPLQEVVLRSSAESFVEKHSRVTP